MLGLGNTLSKTSNSVIPGAGGSPPPVGFDKTFSFASTIEDWSSFNGTLAQIASHTPSSDVEKTGILEVTDGSGTITCSISLDFSTPPDRDWETKTNLQ